ncbi:MAG: DUF4125 family protein [Treponema sp.]|jgi:hypothetical protein|nr:DUF4125 family protein [Treponema sp.]
MKELRELLDRIISVEWDMFDRVQNRGGRASCQDNYPSFDRMRRSQFEAWDRTVLESYLSDLEEAQKEGRNPLAEKYGYMMEYTSPGEYQHIRDILPPLPEEKKKLVRRITDKQLAAYDEAVKQYPLMASRGRKKHTGEETGFFASIETYLLGELSAYSTKTLLLYERYMDELQKRGENLPLMILENTAKQYGFASLEEAELQAGGL